MAGSVPYRSEIGWVRVDGTIDADRAAALTARCARLADDLDAPASGDKPHGGTRRLSDPLSHLPDTAALVEALQPIVDQILTGRSEAAWRCPGPGYGAQRLHADDTPRLEPGPDRCATVIVALVDFTDQVPAGNDPGRAVVEITWRTTA